MKRDSEQMPTVDEIVERLTEDQMIRRLRQTRARLFWLSLKMEFIVLPLSRLIDRWLNAKRHFVGWLVPVLLKTLHNDQQRTICLSYLTSELPPMPPRRKLDRIIFGNDQSLISFDIVPADWAGADYTEYFARLPVIDGRSWFPQCNVPLPDALHATNTTDPLHDYKFLICVNQLPQLKPANDQRLKWIETFEQANIARDLAIKAEKDRRAKEHLTVWHEQHPDYIPRDQRDPFDSETQTGDVWPINQNEQPDEQLDETNDKPLDNN